MKNFVQSDKNWKYVRCKWMQVGKPIQIVSFEWVEDSSEAEILFELFRLYMDLWQGSSVLGAGFVI